MGCATGTRWTGKKRRTPEKAIRDAAEIEWGIKVK